LSEAGRKPPLLLAFVPVLPDEVLVELLDEPDELQAATAKVNPSNVPIKAPKRRLI
jgi:hypothetical protein